MGNVQIKEISITSLNELSTTIEQAIILCQDIQIFIANKLFKRLLEENKSNIIWEELVLDNFHYSDKEEKAFIFELKNNNGIKTIQIHFAPNSVDYMQVTFFAIKGIVYRHYLKGMKAILIFSAD